jgi:uncharacterized protein (TIGR00290 family)
MSNKAAIFWSGGKDSAFALYKLGLDYPELQPVLLVTTVNTPSGRVAMHRTSLELLSRQALSIGLPLGIMEVDDSPANAAYEQALRQMLGRLRDDGISHVVFGDLFLEDLKAYRERLLEEFGLRGVYPLWKKDSGALMREFLEAGFRTLTCCVNGFHLDRAHCGVEVDGNFIGNLPGTVDPCGENGEFHTFCFDGPIFRYPLNVRVSSTEYHTLDVRTTNGAMSRGFWFSALEPVSEELP